MGDEEKESGGVEREEGRSGSSGIFRRATWWGRGYVRNWVVTLRASVFGHRLEPEANLLSRRDQHVVLVDCCAPIESVEVQDEGGKIGGLPSNQRIAFFYDVMNDEPPVYRSNSE